MFTNYHYRCHFTITFGAWSGAELTWLPVAVLVELLTGGFSYRSPLAQTDAPFSLTSSG